MAKGPGLYSDIGKKARGSIFFLFFQLIWKISYWVFCLSFEYFYLYLIIICLNAYIDLLYRDYQTDHKFSITTYSPTGVVSFFFFFFFFLILVYDIVLVASYFEVRLRRCLIKTRSDFRSKEFFNFLSNLWTIIVIFGNNYQMWV